MKARNQMTPYSKKWWMCATPGILSSVKPMKAMIQKTQR